MYYRNQRAAREQPERRKQTFFSALCFLSLADNRQYIQTAHLIYISLELLPAAEPCVCGLNSSAPRRQTAEVEEAETLLVCSPLQSDVSRCGRCLRVQQTDFDHDHVTEH